MKRWGVKRGDVIVVLLLLIASAAITLGTFNRPRGDRAVVIVDGKKVAVLTIGVPGKVEVQGPLGTTIVESDADGVRIVDSPCPHKLCVHMGTARVSGQTLICVPNHVAVRIEGDGKGGVDGVVG